MDCGILKQKTPSDTGEGFCLKGLKQLSAYNHLFSYFFITKFKCIEVDAGSKFRSVHF